MDRPARCPCVAMKPWHVNAGGLCADGERTAMAHTAIERRSLEVFMGTFNSGGGSEAHALEGLQEVGRLRW